MISSTHSPVNKSTATVEPRSVDTRRPMRIICIGAGISGIITAIRFPQKLKGVEIQIYEKNADIGGTWFENRYPGCACDIPAHTYQLTFDPNKEWTQFYASAKEIHQYWKNMVKKYNCMQYIKLGQRVLESRWEPSLSKWIVKASFLAIHTIFNPKILTQSNQIEDVTTGTVFTDSCDLLFSATGVLNEWKWPEIPGLKDFKGRLMHSAKWDESYDYKNKNVAVIGSGSSAIQIVPGIQKSVKHLDNYIRGRTWIATPFAANYVKSHGSESNCKALFVSLSRSFSANISNDTFTEQEIKTFKTNPLAYKNFQKNIELELQSAHGITQRGSMEQQFAKLAFTEHMKSKTANKPVILNHILPDFPPACRRLTPGPGYLEALCAENVNVIPETIVKVTTDGIVTSDGVHRKTDTIVCATGFDTSFTGRFPIIGNKGVTLSKKWNEFPSTYLSIATGDFPNYFIYLGPASGLGTGNLLVLIERIADYFIKCIEKMRRDNIATIMVKKSSVDDFVTYSDKYFEKTVFSMPCRSWYKGGTEDGRINALWPGSSLHAMKIFENPRWEDFEFEYVNGNPTGWLGDGWTENERNHCINVDYLDDENIDLPPTVGESPEGQAIDVASGGDELH